MPSEASNETTNMRMELASINPAERNKSIYLWSLYRVYEIKEE